MPFESTAAGQFKNYFSEFIELKRTEDPADVQLGKVYHCAKDGEVRFRPGGPDAVVRRSQAQERVGAAPHLARSDADLSSPGAEVVRPGRSYGYAIKFSLGISPAPERLTEEAGAVL